MIRFAYLVRGLDGMCRAHQINAMAGHLGAALLAGYFIGEQHPNLDEAVYRGIEGELDRILRGESVFSPRQTAAVSTQEMFLPTPNEAAKPALVDDLADELAGNIADLRESGHNVIFSALAVRALRDHPDLATPTRVEGIRRLIAGFQRSGPGSGYYGKERGRVNGRAVKLAEEAGPPPYADLTAMADTTLEELLVSAGQRRDGFGGLWHVINHAAGLAELHAYGYPDLAVRGLPAHRQHLRLFRTVPDVSAELGQEVASAADPLEAAFWTRGALSHDRAHLDHRIKTLYGFYVVNAITESQAKREAAKAKLRYLM